MRGNDQFDLQQSVSNQEDKMNAAEAQEELKDEMH